MVKGTEAQLAILKAIADDAANDKGEVTPEMLHEVFFEMMKALKEV